MRTHRITHRITKQFGSIPPPPLSDGYWVHDLTLTFDLSDDLDLVFFNVKFRNICISGIVGLIGVKWKGSEFMELVRYWAYRMTLLFDHTYDPDLQVSRSEFEIALSQEWDGRLTWNERNMSRPSMIMIMIIIIITIIVFNYCYCYIIIIIIIITMIYCYHYHHCYYYYYYYRYYHYYYHH